MYLQSGEWVIILKVNKCLKTKFKKSLRVHIFVLLILVSSIPCFMVKETMLEKYEERAVAWRVAEIQNQCKILSDQMTNIDYIKGPVSEVIQTELSQLSSIYDGRIMVIDSDYRIIKDTFGMEVGKTIISPDVITCFSGIGTSRYNDKGRYIEITTPILQKSKSKTSMVEGVMLVSVSTDIIYETRNVLDEKTESVYCALMIVVIIAAAYFASRMTKPFAQIVKTIESITEGFDQDNLQVHTYIETKQISEAFNKMRGRMKVLDDSRQEFVSNVSHELKTPLTSMKVLADSLLAQEDVPVELYREFMGDITEEIERENQIINDLLALVKLDKTSSDINVKSENINELVERILKRLRPIAALRNIELVFESFRPVNAEIDEVKLTLAISNLVENAIKYNYENGWVQVSLNADHKYFYVKVSDSGIGIPQESLDHIFERFYRVDKSHSREINGTGLGLAIARNAVLMHRGAIKVHSEEGEGTTFTIRIPLNYIA